MRIVIRHFRWSLGRRSGVTQRHFHQPMPIAHSLTRCEIMTRLRKSLLELGRISQMLISLPLFGRRRLTRERNRGALVVLKELVISVHCLEVRLTQLGRRHRRVFLPPKFIFLSRVVSYVHDGFLEAESVPVVVRLILFVRFKTAGHVVSMSVVHL